MRLPNQLDDLIDDVVPVHLQDKMKQLIGKELVKELELVDPKEMLPAVQIRIEQIKKEYGL